MDYQIGVADCRMDDWYGGNFGLPLEATVKALRDARYDKRLLIEHDTHLRALELDLKKSVDILKKLFGIRQEAK